MTVCLSTTRANRPSTDLEGVPRPELEPNRVGVPLAAALGIPIYMSTEERREPPMEAVHRRFRVDQIDGVYGPGSTTRSTGPSPMTW